jgi:PTS HPr component phosphorylation site
MRNIRTAHAEYHRSSHAGAAGKSDCGGCVLASLAAVFHVLSNRLNESLWSLSKTLKQMKTTRVTIKWHAGLHMRAAAQLVRLARRFRSSICLRVGSRVADAKTHSVPLRDVTIERYVHRLCLEATIPEPLFKLLSHLPPAADRPLLKAVARRAVWENDARRNILVRYLMTATDGDTYRLDDVVELLKLAETYQPTDVTDLLAHIPHWQQVLRQKINEAASPKPFFNERVQEIHGGGRDQRRQDDSRVSAKENERAFLDRLQKVLAG